MEHLAKLATKETGTSEFEFLRETALKFIQEEIEDLRYMLKKNGIEYRSAIEQWKNSGCQAFIEESSLWQFEKKMTREYRLVSEACLEQNRLHELLRKFWSQEEYLIFFPHLDFKEQKRIQEKWKKTSALNREKLLSTRSGERFNYAENRLRIFIMMVISMTKSSRWRN